jgi:UDP-glucuronate decarboxylase
MNNIVSTKKTVLVTGGAGFIGSHLVKRLLEEGNRVICVDNLYTGSKNNIIEFLDNPNFTFLKEDINNHLNIREQIDEIYNFACPASPVYYQKDPVFTITTNLVGTKNMLDLALQHGAKFLQASTSEVYGDPSVHPQTEEYWGNVNPIGIRACYDEGKRAAETLCFDYYRKRNAKIKVIRIFNTYGPNMAKDDGRVVSNFINQALNNEDITIYGDGNQTRSFQYVEDLINGVIKIMDQDETVGPINLGNPDEFTILELAEKVIELTNSKSKIIYKDLPGDDPKKRKPDISKAKKSLNWKPKISLNNGLNKTIDYFKNI